MDARRLIGAKRWLAKEVLSTCDTYNWRCIDDTPRAYAASILTRDNILAHSGLDYIAEKHLSTGEAKAWWLLAITEAQDKGKTLTSTQTETIADIQKEFERQLIARDRYTYWQSGDTHFYSQDERLTSVYLSYALRTGILPSYHTDIVRYLVESRSQTLSGNTALRILASLMNYSDARGDISFPITYHVTADEQDVLSGQLRNT